MRGRAAGIRENTWHTGHEHSFIASLID